MKIAVPRKSGRFVIVTVGVGRGRWREIEKERGEREIDR